MTNFTLSLLLLFAAPLYSQGIEKAFIPVVPPIYRVLYQNYSIDTILKINKFGIVENIKLNNSSQFERDHKFALRVFSKWSFTPGEPRTIPFTIEIKIIPTDQMVLPDAELEPKGKLRLFAWKPEKTNDPVFQK